MHCLSLFFFLSCVSIIWLSSLCPSLFYAFCQHNSLITVTNYLVLQFTLLQIHLFYFFFFYSVGCQVSNSLLCTVLSSKRFLSPTKRAFSFCLIAVPPSLNLERHRFRHFPCYRRPLLSLLLPTFHAPVNEHFLSLPSPFLLPSLPPTPTPPSSHHIRQRNCTSSRVKKTKVTFPLFSRLCVRALYRLFLFTDSV